MEENKKKKPSKKAIIGLVVTIAVTAAFSLEIGSFLPIIGDTESPANTHVADYYISHALEDTNSPNMVTAVLADYRGFDTLFETCVLFLSGLVVLTLLRQDSPRQGIGQEKAAPERLGEAGAGGKTLAKNKTSSSFGGMVLDASFRAIVPIIMIYGIYVLAHGEVSLGGGFQAGALLACAYLIDRIIPSMDNRIGRIKPENAIILAGGGTFLYALTGMLPMATGGNFLEFDKLPLGGWIGQGTVHLHSLGILLIEIGVTICVMAVITNILEIVMERTHFDD